MKPKRRRLLFLLASALVLGLAVTLVLRAFDENLVFFVTPSDLAERPAAPGQRFRLGGLVEEGSVVRADGGLEVRFRVTDLMQSVPVTYRGMLPDLFSEGQGVVTEGTFGQDHTFHATSVLAKHDENYMPAEVADALKKSGQWKGNGPGAGSAP